MKKVWLMFFVCMLGLTLAACGGGESGVAPVDGVVGGGEAAAGELVLGQLVTVDSATPLQIQGVTLYGEQHAEVENEEGLSSFYLNEWIDFYVNSDFAGGDSAALVYCVPHSEEVQGTYEEYAFLCEFAQPADGNAPNFSGYVYSQDYTPGYFDLVFTYGGQVAYYMVIEILPESV